MSDAQLIGVRGRRGGLTARAAAEIVALDVLNAAGGAVAAGGQLDGHMVRTHIDRLLTAEQGTVDGRLAAAAAKAQPLHVLKVCESWCGGIAKTRRAGRS
ncbi:hypothetical protein NM962_12620 [Mycobacterium sp. SVM_VP21]|nr:hypothetical protein NM962_12620 [Mycobacterium sp. SVM_VP21]